MGTAFNESQIAATEKFMSCVRYVYRGEPGAARARGDTGGISLRLGCARRDGSYAFAHEKG